MEALSRSLSNSSISVSPAFGWNAEKRLTPSPICDLPIGDEPDFVEQHMRTLNRPRTITPEECRAPPGKILPWIDWIGKWH